MDEKEQAELVITFHNTREAIMGERQLLDSGVNAGVMPMPPVLGPGCGIALRIDPADLEKAKLLLGETINGIYCRAGEPEGTFALWNL
jgi:hypothetical protein